MEALTLKRQGTPGYWISGLLFSSLLAIPSAAQAHGAHIQSRNTAAIEIQAHYDSGQPMAEAQVQVFAPTDLQNPHLRGLTDGEGRFLFVPDQPGEWEISVRQAGHGDIAVVPVTLEGTLTPDYSNSGELTPLQRGVVAAAVIWGFVGTALFFWRGKS